MLLRLLLLLWLTILLWGILRLLMGGPRALLLCRALLLLSMLGGLGRRRPGVLGAFVRAHCSRWRTMQRIPILGRWCGHWAAACLHL